MYLLQRPHDAIQFSSIYTLSFIQSPDATRSEHAEESSLSAHVPNIICIWNQHSKLSQVTQQIIN